MSLFSDFYGKLFTPSARAVFEKNTPAPEPVNPTFEVVKKFAATGRTYGTMNAAYFATRETAEVVLRRCLPVGSEIFSIVSPGNQGPIYRCSRPERWYRLPSGAVVNCGLLASAFARNPESKFPHVAENIVSKYLAEADSWHKTGNDAAFLEYVKQFTVPDADLVPYDPAKAKVEGVQENPTYHRVECEVVTDVELRKSENGGWDPTDGPRPEPQVQ